MIKLPVPLTNVWHELLAYETLDLVKIEYETRHGRKASLKRIKEIISNVSQAREYFVNAENSSLSVRPLLLYYGILGLSRALILLIEPGLSESAMKQAHGINSIDWRQTLSGGLSEIGNLKINICDGTFWELLEATDNKSYMKSKSTGVNFLVNYKLPNKNFVIYFKNLVRTFPDVSKEYKIWTATDPESFALEDLNQTDEACDIKVLNDSAVSDQQIKKIACSPRLFFREGKDQFIVKIIKEELYLTQLFYNFFGFGDIYISKPISRDASLSLIPSLFCASYYLGMLSRYFPSIWISLIQGAKGDRIFPLVNKLLLLIRDKFPELILDFIKSPYSFEELEN